LQLLHLQKVCKTKYLKKKTLLSLYIVLFDDATYNPCGTNPGVYFYPDPVDNHNYYQCDESGNAYLLSCGKSLVWDEIGVACSWPPVDTSPPPKSM
jgi:hypothetical protein